MNNFKAYLLENLPVGSAFIVAFIAFFIYFFTADTGVSYWDCPEYVVTASSLQVGHPPGNPVWTLAMRIATLPFPPYHHARVINLWSGLLMALAVFYLARIAYSLIYHVLYSRNSTTYSEESVVGWSSIASAMGALCFAVLDSTWFSAVEAEVYAFSTFLTAFTIWLMVKCVATSSSSARSKLLILIAYILGLSIGVHQLNLLAIPVLVLIFVYGRHPQRGVTLKAWIAIAASFVITGLILLGMMPGAVEWAAASERILVNRFGLPYFSGVILYPVVMIGVGILTVIFIRRSHETVMGIALMNLLWFSGLFLFKDYFFIALLLSILAAGLMTALMSRKAILTTVWMILMLWTGYSAVGLLLVRGYAGPPVNEGAPTDIFSLQRYIAREQYGSKPLFYGPTPYSKPMLLETFESGSTIPRYSRYALIEESPRFLKTLPGARLVHHSRLLSGADSAANNEVLDKGHGYLLSDYRFSRKTTPELNMFFPRITSGAPNMLSSYADWADMTPDNMERVKISTAIDSAGNAVSKMNLLGEREQETALRPTYLQNLRFFLSYQVGYMYLRYLMWNFVGRQNDIPSTGEIDHGNVITGFGPIDRLMVGDNRLMPPHASATNPGRHTYYAIPFLLGIVGIIFLMRSGREGRRVMSIVTLLFLMTGLAIVVYLNQTPGEPRERDYAFIVSYMAFCIWISFGLLWSALGIVRLVRRRLPFRSQLVGNIALSTFGIGLFLLLAIENFPDHDRFGRDHTSEFAYNTLYGKDRDIVFSYGDNFTFPLWYIQEVKDEYPNATVIDVSYLSTPEYVANLMRQGNKGVKFTATAADVAFGAYAFTRVAPDADTVPRPMIEILRELYSSRDSEPTLRHSKALLPGRTMSDTITVNLRELCSASGMIPFRTLMLLDILATNLESTDPRPVSFLTSVKSEVLLPVKDALRVEPFSDTYAPMMTEDQHVLRALGAILAIEDFSGVYSDVEVYIDLVIQDQARRQRGAYIRGIRVLKETHNPNIARVYLEKFRHLYTSTPPGSFTVGDSTFHETLEAAALLADEHTTAANYGAITLLKRSKADAEAWKRYYLSLPAWRRSTVSNDTRRYISTLPKIDSLIHKAENQIVFPDPSLLMIHR